MSKSKNADAIELLEDIHEKVTGNDWGDLAGQDGVPRWEPSQDEVAGEVLGVLADHERLDSDELSKRVNGTESVSRVAIDLYRALLIERRTNGRTFSYEINEIGQSVVDSWDEQTELIEKTGPWENTELNRAQYKVLKLIAEHSEHPMSKDINPEYLEKTGATESDKGYAVSSRLSQLYDGDYVDRTPERPYRYWLTDKGKSTVQDDE